MFKNMFGFIYKKFCQITLFGLQIMMFGIECCVSCRCCSYCRTERNLNYILDLDNELENNNKKITNTSTNTNFKSRFSETFCLEINNNIDETTYQLIDLHFDELNKKE